MHSFQQHSRDWRTRVDTGTGTVEGLELRPYEAVPPDYRPISRQRDNSALQSYLQPRLTPLKVRPAISLPGTRPHPGDYCGGRPWHAVATPGWLAALGIGGRAQPHLSTVQGFTALPVRHTVHTPAPCPHVNQTSSDVQTTM